MFKYAGVVLDWHDDHGKTLTRLLIEGDSLPEQVKTAEMVPMERLWQPDDFALVMLDRGHPLPKYACYDADSAAVSSTYLLEHKDKLPSEAQKVAAANLIAACRRFDVKPPEGLWKIAGTASAGANTVDVSQGPGVKIAARPPKDDDYALITEQGRFYPIDTWDRVKTAETYFLEEGVRMDPSHRRQYAKKLAARATELGYPLHEKVAERGSETWAPPDNVEAGICARRPVGNAAFLDDLFEKRADLNPELYAECLRRHDVGHGIDRLWGQTIPDPWESTFGIDKTAEVIWESGTERLTDSQLFNLAKNGMGTFTQQFTEHLGSEFVKDPKGVFDSLPEPQKKVLARMAADVASSGSSAPNIIG
jgi:hypothetical protein